MYPPINKQKVYLMPGEHPIANLVGEKGLWLPSSGQLTDDDIHRICLAINIFYS
jgi:dTDP-4-amino-4,6-dideoxygalactose transaminase